MMMLNAKDYSQQRGYPLKTIRRLCRTRILACTQVGRVYYIDVDLADEYFREQAEKARLASEQKKTARQPRCTKAAGVNYMDSLKKLRREMIG